MSQPGVPQLAAGINNFSLDIYPTLVSSKPSGSNVFFSPYSIAAVLSMVSVGCVGETQDQVLNTLHFKTNFPDINQLNNAFDQLFTTLNVQTSGTNSSVQNLGYSYQVSPTPTAAQLSLANRVYIQAGFAVKQPFAQTLQTSYHSSFGQEDFANQPQTAKDDINGWVSNVTNGKINNLIATIDPATKLMLVSAIYFKAAWLKPFGNGFEMNDFFLSNGQSLKAQFMRNLDQYQYGQFPVLNATALLLPYSSGGCQMIIILPNQRNGLATLGGLAGTGILNSARYQTQLVDVSLPKFKFEDMYQLVTPLGSLGIKDLFSTDNADLSAISDQKLFVSGVVHKSFISVDENGTEAAAATAVAVSTASAIDASTKKVFNADHPFMFAIQHSSTGLILFLGKVENPTV